MTTLQNKVALVTGSSSGIGRGIAEHFGALGARVVVHGRAEREAHAVRDRIRAAGGTAECRIADLADIEACRGVVRFTIETFGGIDVLVNNAASVARGYIEDAPVELWDAIMAVNLRAPFLCLQEAVKSMKTRGGGSIVNIGSVNAYIGEPKLRAVFRVEGRHDDPHAERRGIVEPAPYPRQPAECRLDTDRRGRTRETHGGQRAGMAGRSDRHSSIRPPALPPRHRPRRGLLRLGR